MKVREVIARWDSLSDDPHGWYYVTADALCQLLGLDPHADVAPENVKEPIDDLAAFPLPPEIVEEPS